jgi:hypothetical protein
VAHILSKSRSTSSHLNQLAHIPPAGRVPALPSALSHAADCRSDGLCSRIVHCIQSIDRGARQHGVGPCDTPKLHNAIVVRYRRDSIDKIAKMIHRSRSAVTRMCCAMGLTSQKLHRVAPPPKAAQSDKPKTDVIGRAGKTTLPPLPSLRDELPVVQAGLSDRAEKRGSR